MNEAVVMQGVRTSRRTIRLDEDLPILSRRLRVTVEELPETEAEPPRESAWVILDRIHAAQRARGFVPRTAAEVDAQISAGRDESEARMREIEALHDRAAQAQGGAECASSSTPTS